MDSMIEKLVDLVNNFDPVSYLPKVDSLLGWTDSFARICIVAAPLIMLLFGLSYLLVPPKEANHVAGYRFYFGMGSVAAWKFTQRFAGIVWTALGLILSLVMFSVGKQFPEMELMDMVDKAALCILWEIGLMIASILIINLTLTVRYDRKGNVRWHK